MAEKKLNRTYNAQRNITFGLIYKLLSLIIPFLTRTIIIRVLGADYLGLSSLFSSILQVLNLSELGFGSAIVFSMYEPIARDDKDELCALLNLYRIIYNIVGVAIIVVGLIALPFLPYLINGSWPNDINIYLLYLLYLFNSGISYFLFAYKNSLFSAYQRVDILSKVNVGITLLTSILQIVVIVFWKNYYAFVGVIIIASVITNLSVHYLSKKAFPDIVCKGEVSSKKKTEIKIKVKGLMINKLCQTSRNAFDSIFVSSFIGLYDTAKYNNYFLVLTAASGIMNLVGQSIIAGIGNSIVTESIEKNHNDLKRINFIYMWIAGWFASCMLCLYQPFTIVVFGYELLFPFRIAMLFVLYFYLLKMGDIRCVYSDAAGLWWENRYRAVIEAILNIVLNYVLGKHLGVLGIVLATMISLFFINFIWGSTIVYKYYFKGISVKNYYGQHVVYVLAFVLASSISLFVCSKVSFSGIMGLIVKGIICLILPNLVLFLFHCRTKQFINTIMWIDNRFHLPHFLKNLLIK